MNLRNGTLLMLMASALVFAASCSKEDKDDTKPAGAIQTVLVSDLPADPSTRDPNTGAVIGGTGQYTFFRFADSTIVPHSDSATTKWDIGFRGTSIILNGGVSGPGAVTGQVVATTLAELTEAPADNYSSDDAGGNVFAAWYNYNMQEHVVTAKPGYILVLRTGEGKYVKMEILSYYEGAPAQPTTSNLSGYYTFRYVYQPDGSSKFTEK